MASFLQRLFSRPLRAAAAAEARGDLPSAVDLYLTASAPDDARRVGLSLAVALEPWPCVEWLRGLSKRLEQEALAEVQRALADALERWVDRAGVDDRRDRTLLEEAATLRLALGEYEEAGDLLARIGYHNRAGEAYALGGCVDKLDAAYDAAIKEEHKVSLLDALLDDASMAALRGRFDLVIGLLDEAVREAPEDPGLRERLARERARILGPRLVIEREGRRVVVLGGEALVIGRDPELAQVVLKLPGLSREHVKLVRRGGRVWVEDMGAKNGAWVDGERLHGSAALGAEGELRLGELARLRWTLDDADGVTLSVLGSPVEMTYAWGARLVLGRLMGCGMPGTLSWEGRWRLQGGEALTFDGERLSGDVTLRTRMVIEGSSGRVKVIE